MRHFTWSRLAGVVLVVAAVTGFVLLAPTPVGGSTTWVSTTGDSMHPLIHAGDLVIVRPDSDYQVGDVVAYRSGTLDDTVVLHRIVADTPAGFVTAGDNNDWRDPDRPRASEILGAMWLHIPGGGRVLAVLASPFVIAALAMVLLTAGGLFAARRSRRRGARRAATTHPRQPLSSATKSAVLQWAVGTAAGAVALAVFAFGQPLTSATGEEIPVQHVAELGYTAPVDAAGIYADGRVRTGDPVFLRVAPVVQAHLDYRLDTPAENVSGTVRTSAVVSASNGWHRAIPLGTTQRFRGPHVANTVAVNLTELVRLAERAEKQAGVTFGGLSLELVHQISLTGTIGGQPTTTTYRPKLTFTLDSTQAIAQGIQNSDGKPVTLSEDDHLTAPGTAPATVTVLRRDIPIGMLRLFSLGLVATSLLLAAVALRRGRTGAAQPQQVFGRRLVHAWDLDMAGRPIVDVADAPALMRLAALYDTVVIELQRPCGRAFLVTADNTLYRYTRSASDPGPPAGGTGQPSSHAPVSAQC